MENNSKQGKVGVVAFGFGEPFDLASNRLIATRLIEVVQTTGAVFVYTDRDVAPHLSLDDEVAVKQLDSTLFPHTYRMAVFAIQQAQEHGVEELYVVAAPCHIWRCLRDLRWVADDQALTITLVPKPINRSVYEPTADTWFTRAWYFWWPMELGYRMMSNLLPRVYKRLRS